MLEGMCCLVIVRPATIWDISAVVDLFWELDTGAIASQPEHFQRGERSVEYLSGIINGEKSDFLVADEGGEIVGFSLLYEKEVKGLSLLVPCRYAYIQDFVVKGSCRNRGIGSQLMTESKSWAKRRGLDYLRLSVLPDNVDAQRFYRRHGLCEQMISMECKL